MQEDDALKMLNEGIADAAEIQKQAKQKQPPPSKLASR